MKATITTNCNGRIKIDKVNFIEMNKYGDLMKVSTGEEIINDNNDEDIDVDTVEKIEVDLSNHINLVNQYRAIGNKKLISIGFDNGYSDKITGYIVPSSSITDSNNNNRLSLTNRIYKLIYNIMDYRTIYKFFMIVDDISNSLVFIPIRNIKIVNTMDY